MEEQENVILPEEVEEKKREIARAAYENGIWSELMCFNFIDSYLTPQQVASWQFVMAKAIRAKSKGGIKQMRLM